MNTTRPTDIVVSRRRALQLLGIGAAATTLVGCAPTGAGTGAGSVPVATAGGKATNFDFASWSLTEKASAPAIQSLLQKYGSENGVKVGEVSFPYNEYINQLMLQVRGGQFTGAAHVDVAWLGSLASLGKLQDVSGLTKGRGYTQSGLDATTFNGVQYGLPWTIGAIGLVTNQAMLDQAGIGAFPTTIDEFEGSLKQLKGLGNGVIPYAASTKAAQLKDILIWMQTFGSPLVDGDEVTIGDDASIAAVTWYKELYDQGLIAADVDRFDARSLFAQGRAAIYDDAIVGRSAVTGESPDADFASKLQPQSRPVLKKGDTPRALVWGGAIAVVDGADSGTAADFAQWVTSDPKTVLEDFAARGLPPATEEALASQAVKNDAFAAAFSERITATATTNPFWKYVQYSQIETKIAEKVQAVLVGQEKPAEAMKTAGAAAQKLLA